MHQLEIVGGGGIASSISGLGVIYVQVSIFFKIKNCFCEHLVNVYKNKVYLLDCYCFCLLVLSNVTCFLITEKTKPKQFEKPK